MRSFLTVAIPRKAGPPSVILGPDKPRNEHVDAFKRWQDKPVSNDLSEVQLWGSSEGIQKRQRLMTVQAYESEVKAKAAKAKAKAEMQTTSTPDAALKPETKSQHPKA